MSLPGSLKPMRASTEVIEVTARFTVSSEVLTKTYGGGISAAKTASGKYTLTFTEFGPVLMGLDVKIARAAGDASAVGRESAGTYSASAGTVDIEIWDVATPTLLTVADTDVITITAKFLKTV